MLQASSNRTGKRWNREPQPLPDRSAAARERHTEVRPVVMRGSAGSHRSGGAGGHIRFTGSTSTIQPSGMFNLLRTNDGSGPWIMTCHR